MSISIRSDVAPEYELGSSFSLRSVEGFGSGSFLEHVRERIADRNVDQFHSSWNFGVNTERNIAKAMAFGFNVRTQAQQDIFDKLWHIIKAARNYKDKVDDDIHDDLQEAYSFAGKLAAGQSLEGSPLTWSRVTDEPNCPNYVIFSDHHMTAFQNFTLENYFLNHNYELYLDVLDHYAGNSSYCLVENGDVEELIIYPTDLADATARKRDLKKFPILMSDAKWEDFLIRRYEKRHANLTDIFQRFSAYYERINTNFIEQERYVRLTGNHDTYSDVGRESELRDRIQLKLNGTNVHDVFRISRGSSVTHLVLHGHQFDTVSIQHGSIPYALSLGEVFSEAAAWNYQGPDRFWKEDNANQWIHGNSFNNTLAREVPGVFNHDATWNMINMGTEGAKKKIKADAQDFVEQLLGHEIAWEYFNNSDAYEALALEVINGEAAFKFRHLNERDLCSRYAAEYMSAAGPPFNRLIPKLVLGHTHEPRLNSVDPARGPTYYYLNSAAAGRFKNLIWCVEITESEDRIVSWSRAGNRLKRVIWRDEYAPVTLPNPLTGGTMTVPTSKLVHSSIAYF